jgi:hypothetical protein
MTCRAGRERRERCGCSALGTDHGQPNVAQTRAWNSSPTLVSPAGRKPMPIRQPAVMVYGSFWFIWRLLYKCPSAPYSEFSFFYRNTVWSKTWDIITCMNLLHITLLNPFYFMHLLCAKRLDTYRYPLKPVLLYLTENWDFVNINCTAGVFPFACNSKF